MDALARPLPCEPRFAFRARQARAVEAEKMQAATDKIERRRKALRRAYDDLQTVSFGGSCPDEDDARIMDAWDLAKELLRNAHSERRALRLAQAAGVA